MRNEINKITFFFSEKNCEKKGKVLEVISSNAFLIFLPKQFPEKGINILQAVAIGSSPAIIVFTTRSSIFATRSKE